MKKLFYILFIIGCFACEKVGTDVEPVVKNPDDPAGLVENTQSVYYTLQGSTVLVDVPSIVDINQSVTSITITKKPTYGAAIFNENNLLEYEPLASVVEANDQIEMEVKTANNKKIVSTIYFKIKAEGLDIPCHTGAISDIEEIKPNETIIVDVLENDKFCNVSYVANSLKIIKEPQKGKASIKNDKITFTSNNTFVDTDDVLLYEITTKDDTGKLKKHFAALKVYNKDNNSNCKIKLINDFVLVPEKYVAEFYKDFSTQKRQTLYAKRHTYNRRIT